MDVNDRELKVVPTQFLSDLNRYGFALVAFIVSILLLYFYTAKQMPEQQKLSHYRITPLAFGTLLASGRISTPRDIGYAYTIAGDALPERYDGFALPPISESSFGMSNRKRYILIHDAIDLSPFVADKLGRLVNQTFDVWFWESKIVILEVNGAKVISYETAVSGIDKERNVMFLAAGLSFLLAIGLILYPRLKLS